jgi:type VI secretion system secreted protein VgrG
MKGTMAHETGHTWSYKTWGEDETKGKWLDWKGAMAKDKVSVSGYAMKAIAEDVAETIQVYVTTEGSPRKAEYRKIVPNRFGVLDKEYK